MQAGSPYFAPDAFWCIDATLARPGWLPRPTTSMSRPSATGASCWPSRAPRRRPAPPDQLPGPLRFLSPEVLQAAAVFPADRRPRPVDPSTLNRPRILDYERKGWKDY